MYVNSCHMHLPEINRGVAMNSQWSTLIASLPAPCSALTVAFSAHGGTTGVDRACCYAGSKSILTSQP